MKKYIYIITFISVMSIALSSIAATDIADAPELGTIGTGDSILVVNADAVAGSRLSKITFNESVSTFLSGAGTFVAVPAGMVYPGAGIPISTGSAWGTSYTLDTDMSTVSASDDTIPSAKATKTALDLKQDISTMEYVDVDETTIEKASGLGTEASPWLLGVVSGVYQPLLTNPVVQANFGTGVYTFLGTPSIGNFFTALTGEGAFAATLFGYADAAAVRAGLGLVIGTNVQAYDADLTVDAIEFVIDGGGSAITAGVKGFLEIPYAATINRATVLCDQSGSIVIDVWKDTYANYPLTVADTITASAKPTVTTATKSQDATLTGWTTSIAAGDIIGFNVEATPTTVTRCTISLKVAK